MKIYLFVLLFLILFSCNNNSRFTNVIISKNTTNKLNLRKEINLNFKPLNHIDTLKLIKEIKNVINFKQSENYSKYEKLLELKNIFINGSIDKVFFVEFEYGFTCGCTWPGKCQLLFTNKGKLIGRIEAEKYKFIKINKCDSSYLYTLETTQHGNGAHAIYKISNDTLENVLDGFSEYFIRTYDSDETGSINAPFELKFKIKDYNSDGLNDVSFSGNLIQYSKKYPVNFIFLFNKSKGHFTEKEDYCKKYKFINECNSSQR